MQENNSRYRAPALEKGLDVLELPAPPRQALPSPILGDWPFEPSGGEMLRRNVRVTPLPGLGDADALEFLAALPELCVWSSDFPHHEGNAEPIDLYRPELDTLDDELRMRFLGENISECFARTGDPL